MEIKGIYKCKSCKSTELVVLVPIKFNGNSEIDWNNSFEINWVGDIKKTVEIKVMCTKCFAIKNFKNFQEMVIDLNKTDDEKNGREKV